MNAMNHFACLAALPAKPGEPDACGNPYTAYLDGAEPNFIQDHRVQLLAVLAFVVLTVVIVGYTWRKKSKKK